MARMDRLTALKVEKARQPGMYADGGGLYLQVTKGAEGINRSWLFRYTRSAGDKRRTREMGLGPLHTIGLAEAREKAREARHQLLDGLDPIDAKRADRAQKRIEAAKAKTFRQCAEAYITAKQSEWSSNKHAAQWEATIATYAYPLIGGLPVSAVDTGLVMKALQQHVEGERGPSGEFWQVRAETASRLRGRIESVLDWATVAGYRAGDNPARWSGHLEHLLAAPGKRQVQHHAALPYAELPGFMIELRKQEGVAARALEFCILAAARTGEVIGARWSEINLTEAVWTVPPERMKGGKAHRVPLSAPAVDLLREMQAHRPAGDDAAYVFPGGKPGKLLSNTSIWEVVQAIRPGMTSHGFRSSFRDWASERTSFAYEVCERALAHVTGSAAARAYARSDLLEERRRLMSMWAEFITTPPVERGEIIVLRKAT